MEKEVKLKEVKKTEGGGEIRAAVCCSKIRTPIGELLLVAEEDALTGVYFDGRDHVPTGRDGWWLNSGHPVLQETMKQIGEYFAKERTRFSLPVRFMGTEFQKKIWEQIALVPYGKTISYTELAKRAGAPEAIRAAGTTTGRNPVSIVIPCHRIVGKNGRMCGFAGGRDRKRFLLQLEATNRAGELGSVQSSSQDGKLDLCPIT